MYSHALYAQDKADSAQTVKEDSILLEKEKPQKSYFQVGLSYLNDNVYSGRKDSVRIPYLTPSLGFYHKSGLYLSASFSYVPDSTSRIDAVLLEGGYDFTIGKFEGEINASKNYYNANSTNVKSEIAGSLSFSGALDFDVLRPTATFGLNFGSATDYELDLGLEHTFATADDKLEITPSFLLNAGTQNYYGSYYSKRRYTKRKTKAGIPITYQVSADLSEVSRFKVMDYEFSVPVDYTAGKFTFSFSPVLALPVNPNTVTLVLTPSSGPQLSKTFTEKLGNTFYWSLGVTCKL